jgi:hypothetical protein
VADPRSKTETLINLSNAPFRHYPILLLLIVSGAFSQPSQAIINRARLIVIDLAKTNLAYNLYLTALN